MGFKRSWVQIPPARVFTSRPCFTCTFCAARRRAGATSTPAKTSITDCAGITVVIRKRHGMAFLGLSSTASASRPGPLRCKGNCITKPDGAEMNWMRYLSRTVAGATGRGFKSRQPEFFLRWRDARRRVPLISGTTLLCSASTFTLPKGGVRY